MYSSSRYRSRYSNFPSYQSLFSGSTFDGFSALYVIGQITALVGTSMVYHRMQEGDYERHGKMPIAGTVTANFASTVGAVISGVIAVVLGRAARLRGENMSCGSLLFTIFTILFQLAEIGSACAGAALIKQEGHDFMRHLDSNDTGKTMAFKALEAQLCGQLVAFALFLLALAVLAILGVCATGACLIEAFFNCLGACFNCCGGCFKGCCECIGDCFVNCCECLFSLCTRRNRGLRDEHTDMESGSHSNIQPNIELKEPERTYARMSHELNEGPSQPKAGY